MSIFASLIFLIMVIGGAFVMGFAVGRYELDKQEKRDALLKDMNAPHH